MRDEVLPGVTSLAGARAARAALVLTGLLAASTAKAAGVSPRIQDYVCSRLNDFTAMIHVVRYDEHAGSKISRDFGFLYKLRGDLRITYKEQDRFRIDGHIGPSSATYVMDGVMQLVRIPSIGIRTVRNLGDSPGKRKTLLDVGLLSQSYLSLANAEFQGERPVDGVDCAVFRVTYKDQSLDTSHRIIWIDPKSRVILKREEYSQTGKLNATYYFKDPKEVARGIWFPTLIQAVNNQGQEAGVTRYRDIVVNAGVSDSLFRL